MMLDDAASFPALVLDRHGDDTRLDLRQLSLADLPKGDVLVRVAWSGLNYKDALAVTNRGRIARRFPLVPGIDLAGTVVESAVPDFKPDDRVLVTGYGIGEEHWGGYAGFARLLSSWLVPVPEGLALRHAMAIGTAGFTAMISVMALEEHGLAPEDGEVAVSGASGGVGSFAVALLAAAGFRVVAATGRAEMADYLRRLGATDIAPRSELATATSGPLGSERWSGAVDSVGGTTLAELIRTTRRHGSVAACGLAGGPELNTTVFPFILRGVNLLGIDSNFCPADRRRAAWQRLAADLAPATIEAIIDRDVTLEVVQAAGLALLDGAVRGRVVVELGG